MIGRPVVEPRTGRPGFGISTFVRLVLLFS
jgi:hypothetical protein